MSFAEFLELMADVMSQTTRWGNLSTKLSGYVGFDTIQEQIKKKSIKRGFELNLMVVGTTLRGFHGNDAVKCFNSASVLFASLCLLTLSLIEMVS